MVFSYKETADLENLKGSRFEQFENLKHKNAIEFENLRHENTIKELEKQLEIAKQNNGGKK